MLNQLLPWELRLLFLMAAIALTPLSGFSARAETLIDWAAFNDSRTSESAMGENVFYSHFSKERIKLADNSTNPPSPFPDAAAGFFFDIDTGNAPQARIWIRTFAMEKKGWVEFPFQIVDGGFSLNFDFIAGDYEKVPASFISLNPPTFMVSVESFKIRAGSKVLKMASGESVTQGAVHTLRVAWDSRDGELQFEVLLDGEALLGENGDPILKVSDFKKSAAAQGINVISLKSKQKEANKFFVGNIQASAR